MTTPYTTGTISLTNGSAVVTGIGTAWQIALIKGGIVYPEAAGNGLPIATVDSDTQITAAVDWTGATGTYSYALVRDTAYDAQIAQNAEALARLLAGLEAGTIWKYDMSGDTAGRDIYDGKPKGFSYLDVSVVPAELWVKASNTEGDWAGPFSYGVGPEGPVGPRGMNWRGAWSNATAYLKDDAVSYNNASWIALVNNTNVTPVAGATWGLVAARGATGATGTSFTYRGTYAAGTAYAIRDVVTYNGSSWIATAATMGNAPPNLPTTSNAYWSLMSAKGTDGTGTGDVVGPAGATDGRVALFNGTTGKLLKMGGAPFSGAYADLSGKPTLGGAAALNVGTTAGTVAAGDDPRFSAGGSSKNEAVFALEIADLKGARLGMNGGVADAFDDETGVATKTNATYDAANGRYYPAVETTEESTGSGSGTGAWATFTTVDRSYAVDNSKTVSAVWIYSANAGTGKVKLFLENSATSFGIVAEASMTHPGGGWFRVNLTTPFVVPSTGTYRAGQYFSTGGQNGSLPPNDQSYKAGDVTGGGTTGFTSRNGAQGIGTRVTYIAIGNMALKSVNYTASLVPASGRLAVQVVEVDSVTINTDLIAKISRDGGTTWATAVLSLSQSLVGPKVYEANNINLSSLASGTSMKWEIDTANNKNVAISGVVMQWS